MRYDVPFISQYEDITDPDWQWRGCGVVALKMILDYWRDQDPSNHTQRLDVLHAKGLDTGAYREGIGWTHAGLAALAREPGYEAYNRDWAENGPTPKTAEQAFEALKLELQKGPVLASVFAGLDPLRKGGHLIVVTGLEGDLVFFNDPEQRDEREGRRTIAVRSFLNAFKRRYIVVRPTASS